MRKSYGTYNQIVNNRGQTAFIIEAPLTIFITIFLVLLIGVRTIIHYIFPAIFFDSFNRKIH
jgi:hypothetical protein